MAEEQHHHHHHHHHKKDGASLFKQRSLQAIETRKKVEKFLKIALVALAIFMGLAVIASRFLL